MRAFSVLVALTTAAVSFAAPVELSSVTGTASHLVGTVNGVVSRNVAGTVEGVASSAVGTVHGVVSRNIAGTVEGIASSAVGTVNGVVSRNVAGTVESAASSAVSTVHNVVSRNVADTVSGVASSAVGTVHDVVGRDVKLVSLSDNLNDIAKEADVAHVSGKRSVVEISHVLQDAAKNANVLNVVAERDLDLVDVSHNLNDVAQNAKVASVDLPKVLPRAQCDCTTIPNIFADVKDQLNPLLNQINSLNSQTCTLAVISGILGQVKNILKGACGQLGALNGKSVEQLLGSVTGTLSMSEFSNLCGVFFKLVFGAITTIIQLASSSPDKDAITGLCGEVVSIFAQIINLLISLLINLGASSGFLAIILPILMPFIQIISQTGAAQAFSMIPGFSALPIPL
ncbi:hypothetical protein VKT23_010412 [Stygiomarasmius scandens]|uniref:Uncharacterized protein n=1 Tax=Marasmiellus scandens TaxID=2682957 RepID=A0ABR1JBL5_9AGAR